MTTLDIEAMSNEDLLKLYNQLYESVEVFECFGVNDLVLFDWVCRELDKREEN